MRPSKKKIYKLNQELTHSLRMLGDTWVPKYKRMMGAPSPIETEAMSSWVERIASHLNIPCRDILAHWGIDTPSFWLDCGAQILDLENIAISTMKPLQSLESLLWPQSSILSNPSYACLTLEPINRRPIYRYCEKCLAADVIPFIRQFWRYACSYVCAEHATILRDHCQKCSWRIDLSLHRTPEGVPIYSAKTIRYCRQCGADLASAESTYLPEHLFIEVLARQGEMISLIHGSSTMRSSTPQTILKSLPAFKTDGNSRIDCTDFANVRSLLNLTLGYALRYQKDMLSVEECIDRITKYLNSPNLLRTETVMKDFRIGVQGIALFGMRSPKIGRHMMACQSLIGGTYWWRFDVAPKADKFVRLNYEELESAYQWTINRGRSRISYKSSWW